VLAVAAIGVSTQWRTFVAALRRFSHLRPAWLLAAFAAEVTSFVLAAELQHRLLSSARVRVERSFLVALTYAGAAASRRQAEAEREKRAKIIAAEGERLAADALGEASDVMVEHPLALQLRNLQTLVEIGADRNTTVVFPAPLMSTIQELGTFLAQETSAVVSPRAPVELRGA
jgi:regulator of protease activity HflC (stomatin/prohibitin superfamily)